MIYYCLLTDWAADDPTSLTSGRWRWWRFEAARRRASGRRWCPWSRDSTGSRSPSRRTKKTRRTFFGFWWKLFVVCGQLPNYLSCSCYSCFGRFINLLLGCTSGLHFWGTFLGCTSGLNLAADLGPVPWPCFIWKLSKLSKKRKPWTWMSLSMRYTKVPIPKMIAPIRIVRLPWLWNHN